jgi:hypothetical protein
VARFIAPVLAHHLQPDLLLLHLDATAIYAQDIIPQPDPQLPYKTIH